MASNHQKKSFYITTPIYYATAQPHLGSLYSTVLADVIARWNILHGRSVFFLTGTDEHGQKIATAAEKAGMQPQAFIDQFIPAYLNVWKLYNIDFSVFMRTTNKSHGELVQALISRLIAQGDIYKDAYHGWYCVPCETFLTEKEAGEQTNNPPHCLSCNRPTNYIKEESYFFRLSKYQEALLAFYQAHPEFILPKERTSEVTKFIESGLRDISISRTQVKWGIPFPQDPEHTLYVWIEALCNYITALGYGHETNESELAQFWPAQVHVMGKDIIRFHGIYWPALLMAAGMKLPDHLLVHGWIKINNQKMSKSLGNAIDPVPLHAEYGADAIRYFMTRYIPINQDGEFSIASLEQAIESDLANDLGNLLNRMVLLAQKYDQNTIEPVALWSQSSLELRDAAYKTINEVSALWNEYQLHMAYARLWQFIKQVNSYFHANQPWKVASENKTLFNEILSATAHALYIISILCWPIMPNKMEQLLASLGISFDPTTHTIAKVAQAVWHQRFVLHNKGTLFIKPILKEPIVEEQTKVVAPATESNIISIDDLSKAIMQVGTIQECKALEGSDKLLIMQVNFGESGMRQILAGIKAFYQPEELIGTQATFITNLAPRNMRGTTSHGMMFCVNDNTGKPIIISPRTPVPNGTRLK